MARCREAASKQTVSGKLLGRELVEGEVAAAGRGLDELHRHAGLAKTFDEGLERPGLVAGRGVDDEVVTLDLEPGTYGIACWVAGADGTPHAPIGPGTWRPSRWNWGCPSGDTPSKVSKSRSGS